MLNGSPTGFFNSNRGIRQGDPHSTYVFIIVIEFWSIYMDLSLAFEKYATIRRDAHNYVTHLLFADDMLVSLKPTSHHSRKLKICWKILKNILVYQ